MTITKAQAVREINRRKGNLPKNVTVAQARARAVREGTFGLLKPELLALAETAAAKKAPTVKKARPTGVGSRGGDPAKAARAAKADESGHPRGTAGWWAAYRASK